MAVDGSGPSVRAVEYAAALARATGATVQLLLAIDTAALRPLGSSPGRVRIAAAPRALSKGLLCEDAEAQLAAASDLRARRRPYTMRIEMKPPLEAIWRPHPAPISSSWEAGDAGHSKPGVSGACRSES